MKKPLQVFVCLSFALLLFRVPFVLAEVYKHTDENGNVTYSDQPPSSNAAKLRVTKEKNTSTAQPVKHQSTLDNQADGDTDNGLNIQSLQINPAPSSNTSRKSSSTISARNSASGGGASGGGASGGGASSSRSVLPINAKLDNPAANTTTTPIKNPNSVPDKPSSSTDQPVLAEVNSPIEVSKPADAESVKWHPGHYLLIYPENKQSAVQRALYLESVIKKDLVNRPFLRGVQKQYFWNKLEPEKDRYDFSEIARDLAMLAKVNKQLVISFQERSFNTNEILAPDYLLTSEYGGGVYALMTGKGFNVNYWNSAVQERLVKLVQALGREFNHHPNLEAIHFEETSHSNRDEKWANQYSTKYYDGVIRVAQAAKKAFPNTVVLQYINYADWNFDRVYNSMIDAGVAVGGPDVFEKDKNLLNFSYKYISRSTNIVPIGMAVQYTNYDYDNGTGPYNPPSINSIYNFAKNELHANYIFWLRRTYEDWNGTDYYRDVMNFMNTLDVKDTSGGLNSRCPIKLRSCQTN